jgi:hypothetical protein
MLLCALALLLQDPFPRADADPEGTVVDERGAPIAGADVELLYDFAQEGRFSTANAIVLARNPLPAGRSDKDGHFVLPLNAAQRTLCSDYGLDRHGFDYGAFWLIVRKNGHVAWREPIAELRNWPGSRVVMPRVDAAPEFADLPWPPVLQEDASRHTPWLMPLPPRRERPLCRRPPSAPPPGTRGDLRVEITVRDRDGRPLAGVRLVPDNVFAACAAARERELVTDAGGRVVLDGMTTEGALGGIFPQLEGYAFDGANGLHQKAEPAVVRTELEMHAVHQCLCRTVDAQGEAVAFARVDVLMHGRAVGWRSNSQGRLVLDDRPPLDCIVSRGRCCRVREQEGQVLVQVEREVDVLLRTPPWQSVGVKAIMGNCQASGTPVTFDPPATAFHLHCLSENGDVALLDPSPGPSLQIGYAGLHVQTLGGFPLAIVDLRPRR